MASISLEAQLKAERANALNSMFNEGFLDEQFMELQKLDKGGCRGVVAKVISDYFEDAKKYISEIDVLLTQPVVNIRKVEAFLFMFNGRSSSVGAKKVVLACTNFRKGREKVDRERYITALDNIRHEFDELHNKFQIFLQLEHQILAITTDDDASPATTINDHSV